MNGVLRDGSTFISSRYLTTRKNSHIFVEIQLFEITTMKGNVRYRISLTDNGVHTFIFDLINPVKNDKIRKPNVPQMSNPKIKRAFLQSRDSRL
jgi:hypothetical protein